MSLGTYGIDRGLTALGLGQFLPRAVTAILVAALAIIALVNPHDFSTGAHEYVQDQACITDRNFAQDSGGTFAVVEHNGICVIERKAR